MDDEDQAWRLRARCRGQHKIMFGRDVDAAKAICVQCPVRVNCREEARKKHETHDIWGGMTADERRRGARLQLPVVVGA